MDPVLAHLAVNSPVIALIVVGGIAILHRIEKLEIKTAQIATKVDILMRRKNGE